MRADSLTIALVGNPNAGKSSIFNQLTGLNQKIGNFPGVTVEKKTGTTWLDAETPCTVVDLPGTYSLYPKSPDERVVFDVLSNPQDPLYPNIVIVVADASNLKRNLLLFTQLQDLGMPLVLVLNMMDLAEKAGYVIDAERLKANLNVPVIVLNGRTGKGIIELKQCILKFHLTTVSNHIFYQAEELAPGLIGKIKDHFNVENSYRAFLMAHQFRNMATLSPSDRNFLEDITSRYQFKGQSFQAAETIARYQAINKLVFDAMFITPPAKSSLSERLDKVLTHRIWGYAIFFFILFLIFQAIFSWATYPMDLIDGGISEFNAWIKSILPDGPVVNLLTEGIIAGLGGVLIFIPQIALLFAFISVLEESGYMARVMFIMDKIMRKFGLNGKSVVPLISGVACAVPAIMATRSIDSHRDRLITIFVTPLMSCSARIPVYTVLIGLIVPQQYFLGVFNLQGIALMGLYLMGFLAAICSAWVMKKILDRHRSSYFIMELPSYKMPRWGNVSLTIWEKVRAFVFQAGKVIMAISIILWVLASYGPAEPMQEAVNQVGIEAQAKNWTEVERINALSSAKLQASYAGHFGRFIEPAIKPLGFDWKIGIALITSFAAREVFIGTMATIYSIGSDTEDDNTIRKRMLSEKVPGTKITMYTPARAFSLLVFYVFAMQCMSTLAVTYRETSGWKYPLLQLFYMTGLAWVSSLLVWQLFGT